MKPISTSLAALALLGLGSAARAQTTYFPKDATIDYSIDGDVQIGKDQNGNSYGADGKLYTPTVSFVEGGIVSGTTDIFNPSTFNMSGGRIFKLESSGFFSKINISGGEIANLTINDDSTANITSGNIQYITADGESGKSTINIRGGHLTGRLVASGSSFLNFYGHNIHATPIVLEDGYEQFTLSGTLQDGSDLAGVQMTLFGKAAFYGVYPVPNVPVPEPGSLALLTAGGLALGGFGRRHRRLRR